MANAIGIFVGVPCLMDDPNRSEIASSGPYGVVNLKFASYCLSIWSEILRAFAQNRVEGSAVCGSTDARSFGLGTLAMP
jgi:hypothetical protein